MKLRLQAANCTTIIRDSKTCPKGLERGCNTIFKTVVRCPQCCFWSAFQIKAEWTSCHSTAAACVTLGLAVVWSILHVHHCQVPQLSC